MFELVVAAGLAAVWGARAIGGRRRRRALDYLDGRFERDDALGAYRQGLPAMHWTGPKARHAVLLLHGYSAAPITFEALQRELERQGIPFYAPTLTGFGLTDMHLLERARVEDWQRDALVAYDMLAQMADEVSVVGMSYGTLLSAFIARQRAVRELVWVAPYFFLKQPKEQAYKRLLASAAGRRIFTTMMPMVTKPAKPGRVTNVDIADPERARRVFHYPSLPLHSVCEVWRAQALPHDLGGVRCGRLTVACGGEDLTIDAAPLFAALEREGVPYERLDFPRSAHGLFHDYEREEAARAIADRLALAHAPEAEV